MYRHCYRPQMYKFHQRLRWSRRRRATMTLSCNIQMPCNENPSAEKKQILYLILAGVSDITATVSPLTHRWQCRKKTNFLLHSQKFLHESSYDGVSGKDYRTMMNSRYIDNWASVFHLWLLEVFSWFQNGSILLTCKRRALIIEDEFKNTYFCWLFRERNES